MDMYTVAMVCFLVVMLLQWFVSMVIVAMIINVVAEVIVAIVWLVYWCFFLGLNGFMDLRILCVQQVSKNVENDTVFKFFTVW